MSDLVHDIVIHVVERSRIRKFCAELLGGRTIGDAPRTETVGQIMKFLGVRRTFVNIAPDAVAGQARSVGVLFDRAGRDWVGMIFERGKRFVHVWEYIRSIQFATIQ